MPKHHRTLNRRHDVINGIAHNQKGSGEMIPDTDGILDTCARCGARAAFAKSFMHHYVECSECGNVTGLYDWPDSAMVSWNKQQRRITRDLRPETDDLSDLDGALDGEMF